MKRDESLQRVLWCAVMFICLAFFSFAAVVTILEHKDKEPAVVTVVYESVEIGKPKTQAAMPIPATQAAPTGLDPMVEDTYLRDDIPLSYELQAMLYGACLEMGVEYDLVLAVIEQETRFQNVTGDGGDSQGYMQIQRKWWKGLMAEIGADDLTDPEDNFRTGCAILRQLLDKYGTVEDALTAYNSGKPGSSNYSRQVMERMKNYG